MQNKRRLFFRLMAAVFILALLSVSARADARGCGNLVLVTPDRPGMPKISAAELEKINGNAFLLTYEIRSEESVSALNEPFDAVLSKTDAVYPFVTGNQMIEGAFFTEQDQKDKRKVIVLNRTAAYKMFGTGSACSGTLKLGQEEYTITGIIDDKKDDEIHLYLPAACFGENPDSFAIKTAGDFTLGQVKNECKPVVRTESGYYFISFGILKALVNSNFYLGLKFTGSGLLLILLRMSHARMNRSIRKLRQLSGRIYLREFMQHYSKDLAKALSDAAGAVLAVLILFRIVISFLDDCLFWIDNASLLHQGDLTVFGDTASALAKDFYLSLFLLAGLLISLIVLQMLEVHGRNNDLKG